MDPCSHLATLFLVLFTGNKQRLLPLYCPYSYHHSDLTVTSVCEIFPFLRLWYYHLFLFFYWKIISYTEQYNNLPISGVVMFLCGSSEPDAPEKVLAPTTR